MPQGLVGDRHKHKHKHSLSYNKACFDLRATLRCRTMIQGRKMKTSASGLNGKE